MDDAPRSSKRRKLDTPSRTVSSPHLNSSVRRLQGRSASRAKPVPNTYSEQDAPTPIRKSQRIVSTPKAVVNGILRQNGVEEEDESVYDDIDGALRIETPSKSKRKSRAKYVLDPSLPHPFKRKPETEPSTVQKTQTNGVTEKEPESHKPLRGLVNGYTHNVDLEAAIQDELAAEVTTPSRLKRTNRGLNGKLNKQEHSQERSPSGTRTTRKRTSSHAPSSVDELQTVSIDEPSQTKPRSTRIGGRSIDARKQDVSGRFNESPSTRNTARTSKNPNIVPDSEDELGNKISPSRAIHARRRRVGNRADHINNQEDSPGAIESDEEQATAGASEPDQDATSVLDAGSGSVLDPTEPSPFNPVGAEIEKSGAKHTVHVLLNGALESSRELETLKAIVMDRTTAKRPVPLFGLEEEYKTVYQLLEQTITAGEGNSLLLIGARGSGKTALVKKALSEVSKGNGEDYHIVRLNGFIHTDDKIALREIWRQLGKEMDIEEDGGVGKNYADALTTLLALLSHPDEYMGESTEQVAKAVIFIMDEFDLFASHPRQTLLYNLFDIAQSRKAPIAVLGLTTRIDVANSLEKRVKSRFSHRYVHLSLAKTFTAFQEMCKANLLVQVGDLSVEERSILLPGAPTPRKSVKKGTKPDILAEWNSGIESLFASQSFLLTHLSTHFYLTKSVPAVLTSFLLPAATLSSSSPSINPLALLDAPSSHLILLPTLSTLSLSLLIAAARLDIIHDSDTCNFNMAYDEYITLASKARIQSAAGGNSASGVISKVWGKDVAKREWEGLVELGLIMPVAGGLSGGFGMCKIDVSLEEIGGILAREKGIDKGLERWCRQL